MRSEHCCELLGDVRGTVEGTVYMCKLQRPTSESDYWRQSLCLSAGAVMSQSPGVERLTVTRDEHRECIGLPYGPLVRVDADVADLHRVGWTLERPGPGLKHCVATQRATSRLQIPLHAPWTPVAAVRTSSSDATRSTPA